MQSSITVTALAAIFVVTSSLDPAAELHEMTNDVEVDTSSIYQALQQMMGKYSPQAAVDPLAERPDVITDQAWTPGVSLGQVAGVDTDSQGNVFVFHRADRQWTPSSFDTENKITEKEPIKAPTIVKLNSQTGEVMDSWGDNMFYMPHGLTVDGQDNVWVTDVGTHQVVKFDKGSHQPSLTLGEKLLPGKDEKHFCKPTSVAVASNGHFFVADGYCNARILKYDKDGKLLKQWGKSSGALSVFMGDSVSASTFNVPHSVALAEDQDLLCVADRENKRIQCFLAGLKDSSQTGEFAVQMSDKNVGRVYGLAYHPANGGVLLAVTGPSTRGRPVPPAAYVISFAENDIVDVWSPPEGFTAPHDIAVTPALDAVFVAEVTPDGGRLWKFIPQVTAPPPPPAPPGPDYAPDYYNPYYNPEDLVGDDELAAQQYFDQLQQQDEQPALNM